MEIFTCPKGHIVSQESLCPRPKGLQELDRKISRQQACRLNSKQELRENLACMEFCWTTCGERVAITCKKQSECAAFADRQNIGYGHAHALLDYRKADQILALIDQKE